MNEQKVLEIAKAYRGVHQAWEQAIIENDLEKTKALCVELVSLKTLLMGAITEKEEL